MQRGRVYAALADVLAEKGYVAVTVQDVIRRAGVSRQTFYQYFDSKADCFAAAYQAAGESLLGQVLDRLAPPASDAGGAGGASGTATNGKAAQAEANAGGEESRHEDVAGVGAGAGAGAGAGERNGGPHRFERLVSAYLLALAADWTTARLCLVEAFAAGPDVLPVRAPLYDTVVDLVAETLGVTDAEGRLACRMVLAATTALATSAVADGDPGQLDAIGTELTRYVRRLWDAGVFGTSH